MSDDTQSHPTPEEQRVIIAHDCAMEILSVPVEDRAGLVDAIASLVLPPERSNDDFYRTMLSIAEKYVGAIAPTPYPTRPGRVVSTPIPPDPKMDLLGTLVQSLSGEQKLSLVRLLSPEQRALFSKIFGVELPDLPDAH